MDFEDYEPTTPNKDTKKRKSDNISPNHYENINSELRELHYQRKKLRDNEETIFLEDENEEESKRSAILIEPVKKANVHNKIGRQKEDLPTISINSEKIVEAEETRPVLWVNKLKHYPKDGMLPNMISFREILFEDLLKNNPNKPKGTLISAFMTTFGYNMELLTPMLESGINVTIANEWSQTGEPPIERECEGFANFTLIRPVKDPTMNYRGAFHPKLWILKFPSFLRVVVATGNLTAGDWIIWSNAMWFRDFPKKSSMTKTAKKSLKSGEFDFDGEFEQTLKSYLQSIIPIKVSYKDLLGFNLDDYFISDIDIVLIPSLPGRFKDENFDKYGHRKIGSVISRLMPKVKTGKPKKWTLTYQTSSMGGISEKYIKEFLASVLPNYISLEQLKAEANYKGGITPSGDDLLKRIRIVYPTKDYVENSLEGPQYSGCLLLNAEAYQKPTFPKNIFYQFQGPDDYFFNEGVIAHLKVFIVSDESGEIDDDSYMYFGSHNFSPGAWGKYEKDYTQFTMTHSELGVLFPPGAGTKQRKLDLIRHLPFKFPPTKHQFNQQPWIFDIHIDQR